MATTGDGNDGETGDSGPSGGVGNPGSATPPEVTTTSPKGSAEIDARLPAARMDYELGLSLRVIGAKVGVSEGTIRLWAKAGGWLKGRAQRDLPPAKPAPTTVAASNIVSIRPGVKVGRGADYASATQNPANEAITQPDECVVRSGESEVPLDEAFRARVRELLENPTRDEAVDVAAQAVVQVVMSHRRGVSKVQAIVDKLAGQLDFASEETMRHLTQQAIEEAYPGSQNTKRRNALLGLVDLRSHASTAKDLATALMKLTQLERQAFGLAVSDDPTPPRAPDALPEAKQDAFDQIREKARLRLASNGTVTP